MHSGALSGCQRLGVLAVVLLLAGSGWLVRTPHASAAVVPAFDHIFIIVMENHSYSDIIGNRTNAPYLNQLADQYSLATNYVDVGDPSLPNYLALTGASTFDIDSDCMKCFIDAPNLVVDRVEASGRSWKAYMESMPSACYRGDHGDYVQHHNPFIYYNALRTNQAECNKVVPYSAFARDLASTATTPNFVWITPNLQHDMHDGSIRDGDNWLQRNVPPILASPAFRSQPSLLIITWDEGTEGHSGDPDQVPTFLISPSIGPGTWSGTPYSHYSLVKTIEEAWGLSPLTANDAGAQAMEDYFTSATADSGASANVLIMALRSLRRTWQAIALRYRAATYTSGLTLSRPT